MIRFVLLALPVVLLVLAGGAFVADQWVPSGGALAARGLDRPAGAPSSLVLATTCLEALGLTGLFLLIQGRGGSVWLEGLLTAGIAWVFRGPVQVLVLASHSRLPREPWWGLALVALATYAVCGLLLAALARRVRPLDEPAATGSSG